MSGIRMASISRYALVVAIVLGLGMIGMGSWFMAMGFNAKGDIQDALLREQITTSQDAPIPGVVVRDAETAKAQQDAIESHTFGRWGPYSQMDREDPNRDTYLKGLTLRNALNLSVVGFGVADLAIGLGVITIILGAIVAGFAIPVHYAVARSVTEKVEPTPEIHYGIPAEAF